jgi:hypothetical protein
MATCTCHPCGQSFTGLTAFDKHQQVDYTRRPAVTCLDPATLGMVRNDHGRWGYPATGDARERLAVLRGGDAEHAVPA